MALTGHLDLVCAVDSAGRSHLSRQSFCAPIHISKPHTDEGALIVNVVNPTAGLLDGDRIKMRVRVETGARLLLTTPSASRVHRMRGGRAEVEQALSIAAGGQLEYWPEMLIPQAGAAYRQGTTISVEPESELIFFEILAPGRVASGEAFAYSELEWATDIFVGDVQAARERYRLMPGKGTLDALRKRFPEAYYASCFVIHPRLPASHSLWNDLHSLHDDNTWVGCSFLAEAGSSIKVVAARSVLLRRVLGIIRSRIYAALERSPPCVRRTGF